MGRLGGRPGGLGEGGGEGVFSRPSSPVGRIAGLSLEIEMFSIVPPGIAILNAFSCRSMTR